MFRRRLLILIGLFVLAAAILTARLAQMQLLWHERFKDDYRVSASGDRIINTTRGSIYGAGGAVLAKDVPSYDLSIHYGQLKKDDWIPVVKRLTDKSSSALRERADATVSRVQRIWKSVKENTGLDNLRIVEQEQYHPIVRDVPKKVALRVRTHPDQYPNLRISVTSRRKYASHSAPHIIGRCRRLSARQWDSLQEQGETWLSDMPVDKIGRRYRMDDVIGVSGIERQYEHALRGKRGYVEHELLFYPLRVEKRATRTPPDPGHNLHLTVRADFQQAVKDAFKWAEEHPRLNFRSGALVMLDVETGGILAAGTYPDYSRADIRNNYDQLVSRQRSPLLFRPTQAALPTGSVYKLISAIAALEEQVVSPSTPLLCEGRVRFQGRWFNCTGFHGRINLVNAIEHSCNSFFFRVGAKLTGEQLASWGRSFGFGEKTGVDYPSERSGQLPTPTSLFGRLNLVIGQGNLLCTPLQVARAMAAVANGGRLVRPHLVARITNRQGEVVERIDGEGREINVAANTLEVVRRGMKLVVSGSGGTARRAGLEEYKVAGKTGTAELGAGQPNHAWFAGYFPHDAPQVAFAVVGERTPGHGGSHAAPILARALKKMWPELRKELDAE